MTVAVPRVEPAPMVPRRACEHPGCRERAAVQIVMEPAPRTRFLCEAHEAEMYGEYGESAPRRRALPFGALGAIVSMGSAAMVTVAMLAVTIVSRVEGRLAPAWAAEWFGRGICVFLLGYALLLTVLIAAHIREARHS